LLTISGVTSVSFFCHCRLRHQSAQPPAAWIAALL